jgi:serine protease inhibitor
MIRTQNPTSVAAPSRRSSHGGKLQAGRLPHFAALAALLAGTAGCDWITGSDPGSELPPEITSLPRALTAAESTLLEAGQAFGLELLQAQVARAPDSTHLVSPFSASVALGMALNAAQGETFEEMRRTLGFEGLDRAAVNGAYRGLLDLLATVDPRVSFQVANSVWFRDTYTIRGAFRSAVEDHFAARVEGLDFTAAAAAGRINDWVSEATRGRIAEIAPDPIPHDAVAYLINALHFLGDWRHAFDPAETRNHTFTAADGSTTPIRLMQREGRIRAGQWRGHQVADLPYGGAAWSMTLVLPRQGASLPELVQELTPAGWQELVAGVSEFEGILGLPRFTVAWEGDLKEALQAMGMQQVFDPGVADLSLLFQQPDDLYVSGVRQKTWMRVDEKGTEAAAVTSVDVRVTSMPPSFIVDRPFLLAIRERHSGTLLFLGAMAEAPVEG